MFKKVLFLFFIFFTSLFGFRDISNDELVDLANAKALLVDVRTVDEWRESGVIQNSSTITYFDNNGNALKDQFMKQLNGLTNGNRQKEIVLICKSGQRSKLVSGILEREGYKRVFNLKDGVLGWYVEKRAFVKYR